MYLENLFNLFLLGVTELHLSAYSIVNFLTVQRYILCIYLANFLPIIFLKAISR